VAHKKKLSKHGFSVSVRE